MVVQARAARSGVGRALWVGAEVFVTCGVLLVLLVVHQLWWTNEQARAEAVQQVRQLEEEWDTSPPGPSASSDPGPSASFGSEAAPSPVPSPGASGQAAGSHGSSRAGASPYAVLRIPRLGLTVPIAPGVRKRSVLDRGFVGHYPGTAGPGQVGNFALAGHRNTHGEPFRYVDRLRQGDVVSVRTRERTYTYRVDLVLPQTSPRDVGVIEPVPRSLVKPRYGYDRPGSYLTLTTCTPEFSSAYRLVVWAKLVA